MGARRRVARDRKRIRGSPAGMGSRSREVLAVTRMQHMRKKDPQAIWIWDSLLREMRSGSGLRQTI